MPEKPLIAIFTNHDDDIYCFRLELIQALLSSGYEVLISCPDGRKFQLMEERYGLKKGRDFLYDDPKIDRRGTNPVADGSLFLHYYSLLKKTKPAVILTYTAKPNVYAGLSAKLLHIPVISNVTGLGSILQVRGMMRNLIIPLFRKAYRSSAVVMFQNSENLRYAWENGFINGKYRLIPGSGAALERFPILDYPEGGNGKNGPVVVFNYIGRILREKGVDDYLEAAKRIRKKYPGTEFNLIGFIEPTEAHYRQMLAEYEQQGIIRYRGEQDDVLPWIRRSHAVIHPSVYGEGMSNVLLENASCGRPLITTDNPGCRETVSENVSGFLFPGGDVDRLCNILDIFLKNIPNEERRKMGIAGREKMEAEFDRKIVIDTYLEYIHDLIGEK